MYLILVKSHGQIAGDGPEGQVIHLRMKRERKNLLVDVVIRGLHKHMTLSLHSDYL